MLVNNKNNPLVSIIIPTYNSENFIEPTIKSVLVQSYQNFEIIIIDDSSTDNTIRILTRLRKEDNRINYYKIPHSGRPSIPRNFGINKAKGDLIAFLDSDDLWIKEKLKNQVEIIKKQPEFIFLYSMSITFGKVNLLSPKYELLPLPFRAARSKKDLLKLGNTIPLSSTLIKTDILKEIGGFDEDPELQIEDYDLWIRLSEKGEFKFIPRIFVYYRIHDSQFSEDWETRKRRLEYLKVKRDLELPDYKFYRNKSFVLLLFRNIIHFKIFLFYKIIGFVKNV